ncbi:hypothetical protein CK203_076471 [Vitis vinifera]|uniref:Uncharacterized protein n=1 Tax=Vitis vinifera TaxID=29760 RepID=A0A438C0G6_VITVI|nr:hypothetical protein CK203_076471 [Vitis vinifera]
MPLLVLFLGWETVSRIRESGNSEWSQSLSRLHGTKVDVGILTEAYSGEALLNASNSLVEVYDAPLAMVKGTGKLINGLLSGVLMEIEARKGPNSSITLKKRGGRKLRVQLKVALWKISLNEVAETRISLTIGLVRSLGVGRRLEWSLDPRGWYHLGAYRDLCPLRGRRGEMWEELVSIKGLEFSELLLEFELVDPPLVEGGYT